MGWSFTDLDAMVTDPTSAITPDIKEFHEWVLTICEVAKEEQKEMKKNNKKEL